MIFEAIRVEAKILDKQDNIRIVEAIWHSETQINTKEQIAVKDIFTNEICYGFPTYIEQINLIDVEHEFQYIACTVDDIMNQIIEEANEL